MGLALHSMDYRSWTQQFEAICGTPEFSWYFISRLSKSLDPHVLILILGWFSFFLTQI